MRNLTYPLCGVLLLTTLPLSPAVAQRGALIEDLFRTVAEAQLQREQRKRIELEQELRRQPQIQPGTVNPILIPSGSGNRRGLPKQISTPSREVADLAQHLIDFSGVIDPLVAELRGAAPNNVAIRQLMPEAYRIAADTRSLIQRCDGMWTIDPLIEPYSALDSRWRQLSFRLCALDGLSNQCVTSVRSCDKLVGTMARCVGVQPQFDRHGLHDLMIIAATHMQSLLDDLEIAQIDQRDARRLSHDLRLLRQHILGEADRVENFSYDEAVTAFTDFTTRWSQFSAQVYAIPDPHLQRRLDRIRQCGDQTYELLWIPPPYNAGTLAASAQRLERECAKILDHLTIRALVTLDPRDQVRLLEASRRMFRSSGELTKLSAGSASRQQLQQQFASIDDDWSFIQTTCRRLPSVNQAVVAGIEHECQQLRSALGSGGDGGMIALDELIQAAASLEGSSEYFEADLKRYERYLNPNQYRKGIMEAAHDVYDHAKELHEVLDRREKMDRIQREAERMLDGWQQLTDHLSDIEAHGLTPRRADGLRRAHQNMAPYVAQIAAALVPR